jgi:hypothetical protein
MVRSIRLAVALGLALAPAAARADEAYAIKIKEPAKGDVSQVDSTDKTDSQTKLLDAAGKLFADPNGKAVLDKAETTEKAAAYRETVLDKEPGKRRATRLERHYDKAQATAGGKAKDLPYQGKTVVIEKKEGKYHFRIKDGAELEGDDAKQLDEEFNKDPDEEFDLQKAVLPGKAVAVNGTWKLDMGPLVASFARATKMQIDADKAEGSGKLVKVYDKDGARFGVMELHLDLPLKEMGEGKNKLALEAGSKWTMDITLDGCIDGSRLDGTRKSVSKIDATGAVPLPDGSKAKLTVVATGNSQETSKEGKK